MVCWKFKKERHLTSPASCSRWGSSGSSSGRLGHFWPLKRSVKLPLSLLTLKYFRISSSQWGSNSNQGVTTGKILSNTCSRLWKQTGTPRTAHLKAVNLTFCQPTPSSPQTWLLGLNSSCYSLFPEHAPFSCAGLFYGEDAQVSILSTRSSLLRPLSTKHKGNII